MSTPIADPVVAARRISAALRDDGLDPDDAEHLARRTVLHLARLARSHPVTLGAALQDLTTYVTERRANSSPAGPLAGVPTDTPPATTIEACEAVLRLPDPSTSRLP